MPDAFLLVLHSHLPYVRGAGRWPHGEEWVHEAILGTYLPLLTALHDLREDGVPYRLTVGLTPTLLEQLAHPEIRRHALEYLDDQIARAAADRADAPDAQRRKLAEFYLRSYRSLREAFLLRFGTDLPAAFADLARSGHVELLTSGATHGYLPLLDEDAVHEQLSLGAATTRRITGIDPTGIWLPECAYRPGLETLLEAHGLDHFFTDAPLLAGANVGVEGRPFRARAAQHWSGAALAEAAPPGPPWADVHRPYLVGRSGVAAFARHPQVSGQVWSAHTGYPGDGAYREFHRKDDRSGLRYWRVTSTATDLGAKAAYDPERAAERVRAHAQHFIGLVRGELAAAHRRSGGDAIVTTTFDSELFGHWWYEGPDWLSLVLRGLADLTATAAGHLAAAPPRARIALREGSWGKGSDHSTWLNADTEWMWRDLARMAEEARALAASRPSGRLRERALRQARRELLLAQSSDWPFLVTTGQARAYAIERFRSHAQRFTRAAVIARGGTDTDEPELLTLERADDVFPDASLAGVG